MESIGVISKVNEPSAWCASMVAVPKPNGLVRICVDVRPLNQNVMRETFPLPTVDDVLAQLNGATVFSKLDANSGFWQVPLAPLSRQQGYTFSQHGWFCKTLSIHGHELPPGNIGFQCSRHSLY